MVKSGFRTGMKRGKNKYIKPKTAKDKQQDKKIQKIIKTMAPEVKYLDSGSGATVFNTWFEDNVAGNGVINSINAMSQGVTNNNRIGNKIHAKSLNIRYMLKANATPDVQLRILIVSYDKKPASYTEAWKSVLQYTDYTTGNIIPYLSPYAMDPPIKYKILHDKILKFDTLQVQSHHHEIKVKLGFPIEYTGTALTDFNKNCIYMFMIDNDIANPTLTGHIGYSYVARLKFTDA